MGRKEGREMFCYTNRPVNDQWVDFEEWLAMLTLHQGHHHRVDYTFQSDRYGPERNQRTLKMSCVG